MSKTNSTEETFDDEIDFGSIFAILWKRRKLIVFGTLGATLLSIGISCLTPRVYRSEGFYQLGNPTRKLSEKLSERENSKTRKTALIGVPVPLYKSNSTQFFNPNRFKLIASQHKPFKEEDLKQITADFRKAEDISKWVKPVYAFAKEDVREFSQLPQDESNSVIGLNLFYEAYSPENAYIYVNYFGKYIRDCLLYATLYNYVMDEYSISISEMNTIENKITAMKFELLQNTNKMKDIRAILANYPESAKIETRQLVSVQEGGNRFLAPVTQLVGIESTLADLRRDLAGLERTREKLTTRVEYFSRCYSELPKIGEHGESLFLLLKSIKDEVFNSKALSKDEVKEVFNSLNIDLQAFELNFFSNSRFVSGPTIPNMYSNPRTSLVLGVSFLISFFLFVIYSFVLHWWQRNKKAIMPDLSL